MTDRDCEPIKWKIAHRYALWCIQRAMFGVGKEIDTSGSAIRVALNNVDFDPLFDKTIGPIDHKEFDCWHIGAVCALRQHEPRLSYGWAAKMIAMYLKTTCYLAGFGREGLPCVIHPPLDTQLRTALSEQCWETEDLKSNLAIAAQVTLRDINGEKHTRIIEWFKDAARELNRPLFELEEYWDPK